MNGRWLDGRLTDVMAAALLLWVMHSPAAFAELIVDPAHPALAGAQVEPFTPDLGPDGRRP